MKPSVVSTAPILLTTLVAPEGKIIFKEKRSTIVNNYELLENGLKEIYWSKRVVIKLLDQMIRKSFSEDVSELLEEHQVIAHRQLRRTEDIFSFLYITPETKICSQIKHIINESFKKTEETEKSDKRDTLFIMTFLKIQKYWSFKGETLCDLAEILGEEKVKNFLEETQMEGNLVDLRLGYILEKKNNQALNNPVNIMEPYL